MEESETVIADGSGNSRGPFTSTDVTQQEGVHIGSINWNGPLPGKKMQHWKLASSQSLQALENPRPWIFQF